MKTSFLHKSYFGIKIFEYLWVFALYLIFAFNYHLTLWVVSSPKYRGELFDLFEFARQAGLNYLLILLLTIPIWWLVFRKMRNAKMRDRIGITILLFPLFAIIFQQTYYFIADTFDWTHLPPSAQAWDIYIPGLFYCLQFGIFHAYHYFQANKRDQALKAELSQSALKSELSALKAQLNPHFLYNVFNTISASVPSEQERTRELIAKVSDLFRYQLKASKSELVSLREELFFINTYLELEKARFEERLRVQIDVPEKLLNTPVPPMILQPLVENAVKHGISSLIEGGEVSVKVYQTEAGIQFEVADTGVGVKDKAVLFSGVGLSNTKLRIEKRYGTEMKFSDNLPSGLKIEFAI